jgi:hypothetical protein
MTLVFVRPRTFRIAKFGIAILTGFECFLFAANAQRVGIGTTTPLARLAIDSGVLIDQSNLNQGTLAAGALVFGSDGRAGISRSNVVGSGARNGLGFVTGGGRRMVLDSIGRLGIGTSAPEHSLQVMGNGYFTGNVGLGVPDPAYDLEVGSFAKIAGNLAINANPSINYRLLVNGDSYFQNSNIGINILPSSTYSLQAAGSIRFTENVRIEGELNPNNPLVIGNNASVAGSLTVGGRGIVRGSGSAQWRLLRTNFQHVGGVQAKEFDISSTRSFSSVIGTGIIGGIFVGKIIQTSATAVNIGSIGLLPTNITNTSCRFTLFNGSNETAITSNFTNDPTIWEIILLVFDE